MSETSRIARLLEALARQESTSAPEAQSASKPDEDTLWAFLDGDLPEAEEDAVYQSVVSNPDVAARAQSILRAKRKVAAEEEWSAEQIASLVADRARTSRASATAAPEGTPSPFVGQVIEIGRQALELISIGPGLLRPALTTSPVLVRSDPDSKPQAPSDLRWTRNVEGVELNLTIEPSRSPSAPTRMLVERVGQSPVAGCQIELRSEDGALLKLVSVDALPDRLDLPQGCCRLDLVTPTSGAQLLEWNLSSASCDTGK